MPLKIGKFLEKIIKVATLLKGIFEVFKKEKKNK